MLSLIQSTRGGKDYIADFETRQTGTGFYADLIAKRHKLACERLGLVRRHQRLRTDLFVPPSLPGQQLSLL